MPKTLERLKALLESQESFPCEYLHKFVGYNTDAFHDGVKKFEKRFAGKLTRQGERTSKGEAHVALTYVFYANTADEIIEMMKVTGTLPDLVMIL